MTGPQATVHLPDPEDLAGYPAAREIGRGGMGTVYLVQSRSGWLAVKRVAQPVRPEAVDQRQLQERARLLAGVTTHPHLVRTHDLRLAGTHLCVVMEFVNGPNLRQVLARQRPPVAVLLAWVEQLADALDLLHTRGLVHGDVKPSNVLVTPQSQAKLGDLWLPPGPDIGLPPPPQGTPAYLAPERIMGGGLDGRTDVYGLAVLACEALGGPLPGPPDQAGREAALRAQLGGGPAVRVPALPRAAVQVLLWGLSKTPEGRPDSAGAFACALRRAWPAASGALPPASGPLEEDPDRTLPAPLDVRAQPAQPPPPPGAAGPPRGQRMSPALVAVLAAAAAAGLVVGGLALAYLIGHGA